MKGRHNKDWFVNKIWQAESSIQAVCILEISVFHLWPKRTVFLIFNHPILTP